MALSPNGILKNVLENPNTECNLKRRLATGSSPRLRVGFLKFQTKMVTAVIKRDVVE